MKVTNPASASSVLTLSLALVLVMLPLIPPAVAVALPASYPISQDTEIVAEDLTTDSETDTKTGQQEDNNTPTEIIPSAIVSQPVVELPQSLGVPNHQTREGLGVDQNTKPTSEEFNFLSSSS